MSLWSTREKASSSLEGALQEEAEVVETAFALLDEAIQQFENIDSAFARVCGLTLIKARNLALGSYGLMLDGLGQEAGALLRPFIEALELLVYFRMEPSRVDEAIDGNLPNAGMVAQRIEGEFHSLRRRLNDDASHFGFTFNSVQHLVDFREFQWRSEQSHSETGLKTNLSSLFVFLTRLNIESAHCLAVVSELDNGFVERIEQHCDRGFAVFFDGQQQT